ncbi:MAG: molecular chaperone HtpG, partial [Muribaculaceae bacterium]|nr:molecular chaperone HtpG [Muribaculaceae bacterium]
VSQRLEEIFKANRMDFESKWDDIKVFIEYGMLTDDKFRDAAMNFCLLKDTEGKFYTLPEYRTLIEGSQTDAEKNIVYLYTTDTTAQFPYISEANARGYNVLVMDGQLDSHFVGLLEQKTENSRFVRVDSDIIDNLISHGDKRSTDLSGAQLDMMTGVFKSQIPAVEKAEFMVQFEALAGSKVPVTVTLNEYMRRMKEMAAMQPGMNFYGQLPDSYTLVVNTEHPLVARVRLGAVEAIGKAVEEDFAALSEAEKQLASVNAEVKDSKPTDEQQKKITEFQDKMAVARKAIADKSAEYAGKQPLVKQLIDLALLSSGLLKGRELSEFINRSVSLL